MYIEQRDDITLCVRVKAVAVTLQDISCYMLVSRVTTTIAAVSTASTTTAAFITDKVRKRD